MTPYQGTGHNENMHKVLLCYEDFSEVMAVQPILKKVGFDTASISSEFSLNDQLLTFNPDIVIGCGRGGKVSTAGVGRRLKENPRWTGKVILIFPPGVKPEPEVLLKIRMDVALEAPVEVTRLIVVLASLTGQDSQVLIERVVKTLGADIKNAATGVAGGVGTPSEDDKVYVGGGDGGTEDRWQVSGGGTDSDRWQVAGGTGEPTEGWQVAGSPEMDDFNRLMGLANEKPVKEPTVVASETPPAASTSEAAAEAAPPDESPAAEEEKILSEDEESAALVAYARQQMEEAAKGISDKVQRYPERLTKDPQFSSRKSSISKTASKRALKKMKENWSEDDLQSQDELRREFTDKLFKKKN